MEPIAEGGFGVVHRARHHEWGAVVYKELKSTIIKERSKFVYFNCMVFYHCLPCLKSCNKSTKNCNINVLIFCNTSWQTHLTKLPNLHHRVYIYIFIKHSCNLYTVLSFKMYPWEVRQNRNYVEIRCNFYIRLLFPTKSEDNVIGLFV